MQTLQSNFQWNNLKSQNATSRSDSNWGGRRKAPLAFTEHGAIMAASVLNSEQAIQASLYVVRAFVKLRNLLTVQKGLESKLKELEIKTNKNFSIVFDAIRELSQKSNRRRIGYWE